MLRYSDKDLNIENKTIVIDISLFLKMIVSSVCINYSLHKITFVSDSRGKIHKSD